MKYVIICSLVFVNIFANTDISIKKKLKPFLPENPVIIDSGAYDGTDTLQMISIWPQATIYAFEPVPNIYNYLNNRTQNYPNIICIPKALSNLNSTATMYISQSSADNASSSLLEPTLHLSTFPQVTFPTQIKVETVTLDSWAAQNNINHIDFLWFDMQGMELAVLKASPHILKTIKVIYTEVSYKELYKDSPLFDEVKNWLEEQGFVNTDQIIWHTTYGDAIFIRKEILENVSNG